MRQCNGVRLSSDRSSSDGKLTSVQAAKFDFIGDFNYLIYASRNHYNLTTKNPTKQRELVASLKIYSPRHNQAVYEVELPFSNATTAEKFWVAFCIKGGSGMNNEGVTVSDPTTLQRKKPAANKECVLDPRNYSSHGISQPSNVQANLNAPGSVDISWTQPIKGTEKINNYRIFVQDTENKYQALKIQTNDKSTSYKLNTPAAMSGKFYTVTVQAISKRGKMSLLSDPAVFGVKAS